MYNGFGAYPQDDMDMGVNSYFGESDTNFFGDTSNDSFFGEGAGFDNGFNNCEMITEAMGFSTDGMEFFTESGDLFEEAGIGTTWGDTPNPKQKPAFGVPSTSGHTKMRYNSPKYSRSGDSYSGSEDDDVRNTYDDSTNSDAKDQHRSRKSMGDTKDAAWRAHDEGNAAVHRAKQMYERDPITGAESPLVTAQIEATERGKKEAADAHARNVGRHQALFGSVGKKVDEDLRKRGIKPEKN